VINYDELLAPAAKSMRPSGIRKFFDLAADMPHCISLGVGEPDFKTPWSVRDAGIRSLELGRTKYTANAGLKELRSEICNYLARRFELHYKEENVLVTVGGSEAIDLTIRALVQPGDEVVIPEPCFVCYEPITQLTGGVPVHIATRAEDQFRLTADQLRAAITPKTKLLIFPYPNNPTGAVMSAAEMEEIAAVLRETNVVVLSDEIYSELTYGLDRHVSIASHGRAHHRSQRLLQILRHDRLAAGLRCGSCAAHQGDDENSPELHHVGPHHQPVRRHHGAAPVRRPDRDDA
jgi:aminotransferase